VNLDKQNQLEYHYKKAILDKLYQKEIISFIEFYNSLLALFEEHKIFFAK